MRRVVTAPLRELFTLLEGPAVCGSRQVTRFAGRLVVAIDGTQMAVADTEANRARYPKPRGGLNGEAGYPMVRLVAILTAGTRSVIDAAFGTDAVGELTYARQLISCLQPGMVLLGDRNFATYDFFREVAATGADFLFRARTGLNAMKLPVLQQLADGSYLSHAAGQRVRVIDAELTVTTEAKTLTAEYRLVTTLLDPVQAPAPGLVRLYHERWEIETAYCELKSRILNGRVLRGRHPGCGHPGDLGAAVLLPGVAHRDDRCDAAASRDRSGPPVLHHRTEVRPRPGGPGPRDPHRNRGGPGRSHRGGRTGRTAARPPHPLPAPGGQTRDLQVPRQGTGCRPSDLSRDTRHQDLDTGSQPLTERHWV